MTVNTVNRQGDAADAWLAGRVRSLLATLTVPGGAGAALVDEACARVPSASQADAVAALRRRLEAVLATVEATTDPP